MLLETPSAEETMMSSPLVSNLFSGSRDLGKADLLQLIAGKWIIGS